MKKFFKFITITAAAVASLISCNKETNPVDSIEKEYTYTFTLSNPDTKAYLDLSDATAKWESGDQLGVYADTPTGISYNRWGNITLSEPVIFQISSFQPLTVGSKIYCYFPYDAENSKGDAQDPAKVNLSIPTTQNGKMNAMPMVSVPYAMTKEVASQTNEPIDEINMRNLGGVFQFNIFSTNAEYQTETIEKVEFNANAALAGSFVYDITKEDLSEISGLSESTVIVEVQNLEIKANKDESSKVLMVVAPGSHSGSLVVTTDVAIYTLNFTSTKQVERSHVKPLNVDLNNAVSRKVRPGSVTKTMSEVVSENGYEVSSGSTINTIATEIVLDDVVTMSTTGEPNCGSFWGTEPDIDWRLYQNQSGNIILSLAEGYKMISVIFEYKTKNYGVLMYGTNTLTSGTAFEGIKGQSSATFDVSASSGEKGSIQLTSVTVTYTSGEIEKDDSEWLLQPEFVTVMVGNYEEVVYATDFDGDIDVSIDDDTVADVVLDKEEETITVTGKMIGNAVVTITATGSARFNDTEVTIPVEVIAKQKVEPDVTIATSATVEAEATVELGLKIDNNYDGAISAASAAEGTATASYANGKVIINGVAQGTTIVTVSAEATENFNAFSREIAVTVTEKSTNKAVVLANGKYSASGVDGIITWNEGVFTVVQSKGSSSTNVNSNYVAKPRFYASHVLTVTPAAGITIKKIEIQNPSTVGKFTCTVGKMSSDGLTWTGSSTEAIALTVATRTDMGNDNSAIVVYYTGSIVKTDATVTFDAESVTVGEGLTATVNITNNNFDKALSVSSNNENATASISGNVITVNGVSEGSATITVSGSGSDLYNDVSKTISVTVNATQKFAVNIDEGITGGTVTADKTSDIPAGVKVTLTVTPETGKKLKTLTVTNASTPDSIETTKTGNETYTFIMPEANVNVTAVFEIGSKTKKTATLTISSGVTSNCNIEDNKGNIWAVSSDGKYTSSTTFIQVGTNSANVSYLKLSTSAYKDIEKVQVWGTSKVSTNVTPKINIDGSNKGEGSVYTSQTASSGGTEFSQEFSPRAEVSNTLEIEISRASSAKGAIYFNKAIITYYE